MTDPILARLTPVVAAAPGVAAVALGGSRARGTATETSDYDLGLYFQRDAGLDTQALRRALDGVVDEPPAIVTPIGEWGPWIVGGAWLRVEGLKVDLLYRPLESVTEVIDACTAGDVRMDYQPGHPHGFCSAIWMGEVALCRPLHDPAGALAALKARTSPYPDALRAALLSRFLWEVRFSIENAELGDARNDETHVAGCAYRALACFAQVLFALNRRYLINEKAALAEAASFPLSVPALTVATQSVWRGVGNGALAGAVHALRRIEVDLRALVETSGPS